MEAEINEAAKPLFLEGNSDKAVLIIHGFTGYPGEYYELAEKINREGYAVSLPLLPGHGRNREAFKATNWRDWLSFIIGEYETLEKQYRTVSIVGLSMGGVLTIHLAARFKPERIALLAPAVAIRDTVFYLTPFLRFFMDERPKNWTPAEGDSAAVRKLGEEYWKRHYIRQIAGLNRLSRQSVKMLGKISSPALIMVSETDQTVPPKAASIIEKGLKYCASKRVILKNSPHVLVSGPEKDYVAEEVIGWLNEGKENE